MKADALYILGDFFEVWIGDDDQNVFNQKIIESLRALTDNGVRLYFMSGNRDFIVGRRFIKAIGGILLEDPSVVSVCNARVLLSHGDLLIKDYRYRLFRQFIRSVFLRRLFVLLPLSWRRALALKIRTLSEASRKRETKNTRVVFDIEKSVIENLMQDYSADYFIHGHFHHAEALRHHFGNKVFMQIMLGDWQETQGSYLIGESSDGTRPVFTLCKVGDNSEKTKKTSEK